MKPRERLLTVLQGKILDCVPVAPDFSNMIPAKLTGKPFWDLYLYNDPPIWEAYNIQAARKENGHLDWKPRVNVYYLHVTPEDVAAASRKAIDDAALGGRFILSTGDQCGRDTPFENIHAMVETARDYGRY